MDVLARMTSKGQVTVPKAVREAMGLKQGDSLLFRVDGEQTTVKRIPNFIELAGSVEVPPELRGASWEEIRRRAREAMIKRNV